MNDKKIVFMGTPTFAVPVNRKFRCRFSYHTAR